MKNIFNNPLRKEIILVLLIKLAFIYALWLVFFSDPIDKQLSKEDLGQILFGQEQGSSAKTLQDFTTRKGDSP